MNRTDIIIVALRLLAIYLLALGLTQLPMALTSLYATLTSQGDQSQIIAISTSLFGITYFIACFVIWTYSPRIAKLVEGDLPQFEAKDNEFTPGNILSIGIIILGLFVLSNCLPAITEIIFAVLLPSFDTSFEKVISSFSGKPVTIIPWSDIASLVVRFAIGVWFVLGAKGIVTFLKKVRYAGRDEAI